MALNIRSNNNNSSNSGNKSRPNQNFKNIGNKSSFCTHCKQSGHTQEICYRLHGFPPGYRNNQSTNDNRVNSVAFNPIKSSINQDNISDTSDVMTGLTNS